MNPRRAIFLAAVAVVAASVFGLAYIQGGHLIRPCGPTRPAAALGYVHFDDTATHTSLALQTNLAAHDSGAFTYTSANGAEYHGGPVTGLRQVADSSNPLACAGLLHVTYMGTSTEVAAAAADKSRHVTSTAQVRLAAILDLAHLTATIQFADTSHGTKFTTTTTPPANPAHAVATLDQATIKQDWSAVYGMMSSAVVSGYTDAQFARLMASQANQVGVIQLITPLSSPRVGTMATGMTYFEITERVTMLHVGSTTAFTETDVYVLEDGAWKFLFSQRQ